MYLNLFHIINLFLQNICPCQSPFALCLLLDILRLPVIVITTIREEIDISLHV